MGGERFRVMMQFWRGYRIDDYLLIGDSLAASFSGDLLLGSRVGRGNQPGPSCLRVGVGCRRVVGTGKLLEEGDVLRSILASGAAAKRGGLLGCRVV